jgi:transcriptional regulator with PAS, ATPase and Fis domain
LRDRKSDIPLLCSHFLAKFNVQYQKNILRLHPDALGRLMEYNFPGNVRELSNLLEHAAVFCAGDTVHLENFPKDAFAADGQTPAPITDSGISTLDNTTTAHILKTLEQAGGNKTLAARRLGIHKTTLMRKLKRADDESGAQK